MKLWHNCKPADEYSQYNISSCTHSLSLPLVWAHHAAVSSETPESCRWWVSPSGLLQRSRWWERSCSRLSSGCFLWWSGRGVACPYWSGSEWCSGPKDVRGSHVKLLVASYYKAAKLKKDDFHSFSYITRYNFKNLYHKSYQIQW